MSASHLIGKRLGQYEITETIGKGGMAVVYKARQESMGRFVAIKVMSNELATDSDFVSRFEHEVQLIAHLQHPNILPVYDFGRDGELIYLVMRLVDGGCLSEKLRSSGLPLTQVAQLLDQIGSALTYAHSENIVHRDLKPNNILLDKSGSPYLTDFGIAKLLTQQTSLTATGMVMGTPSYMAPEQWKGEPIDARTDVYALGCMLYELLTGKLPFYGETPYALMYKHFDEAPPTPDKVIAGLPAGINAVIARAMAKKPDNRFSSATEMAQAFRDAMAGISTPLLRTVALNNNMEATVIGEAAPASENAAATLNHKALSLRRWLPIGAGLVLLVAIIAGLILFSSKPAFALERTLQGHTGYVNAIAWSPDGRQLASVSDDRTIRVWNPATGEEAFLLQGDTDLILSVVWSPDGSKLATASNDGTIRFWDAKNGTALATLTVDGAKPQALDWSPDGTQLVSGETDSTITIWDVAAQKAIKTINTGGQFLVPVAWSPNGKIIASIGKDNSIQLWDAKMLESLGVFAAHTDLISSLAWSRDSSRLASASHDGTVKIWNVTTGKAVPLFSINASLASGVSNAAWSPDGHRIASSSGFINMDGTNENTIKIWDAESGALIATLQGHDSPVRMAIWSPDGSSLASAGLDNMIKIWKGN